MEAVMGIGGALVGGLLQSKSASKAAKAQTQAADRQIQYQEETRDQVRGDLAPWREGGQLAQGALMNMLGLGSAPMIGGAAPQVETYEIPGAYTPSGGYTGGGGRDDDRPNSMFGGPGGSYGAPTTGYRVNGQNFGTMDEAQAYANANRTGGTEWGGWQTDPGYEFRLGEGQRAIEASAAARGGLNSGATMRDLQKYGQDYGSAEFGNVWNRLAGVSGAGMGAAQMSGNASMQTAGNVGNALGAIGNAQAAGAIGQGNAWGNALGNIYGIQNYQKQMGSQTGGNTGGDGNFFNMGSWWN
jgi:hypothetical protein